MVNYGRTFLISVFALLVGNQRIQKFRNDGKVEVITVAGSTKNARTFDCAIDLVHNELVCSKVPHFKTFIYIIAVYPHSR